MAIYNEKNEEIPDNTPVELPIGYTEPESLQQLICRMIQAQDFMKATSEAGLESFEEADDFDVDEEEMVSEHEMHPMQEEFVQQVPQQVHEPKRRTSDKKRATDKEEAPVNQPAK